MNVEEVLIKGKRLHEYSNKHPFICKWCGYSLKELIIQLKDNTAFEMFLGRIGLNGLEIKNAVDEHCPCIFVSDAERSIRDIIE